LLSLGGRNMLIDAGPRDQRPAQSLPDYGLIYRGEPLDADLTIAGAVRVTLHVESDCPDTDFVAKLIEVTPEGRAMLLMDGVMRAMYRDPSAGPQPMAAATRYHVVNKIAHGGMAEIFLALQLGAENFQKTVVLKRILPQYAAMEDFVTSRQRSIPIQAAGLAPLTHSTKTIPTIYHPNSRANTSLESHTPTNNATMAITIRIVFVAFGATARVMRSAEDTRPDATELNVLVFCEVSL